MWGLFLFGEGLFSLSRLSLFLFSCFSKHRSLSNGAKFIMIENGQKKKDCTLILNRLKFSFKWEIRKINFPQKISNLWNAKISSLKNRSKLKEVQWLLNLLMHYCVSWLDFSENFNLCYSRHLIRIKFISKKYLSEVTDFFAGEYFYRQNFYR